MAEPDDKYLFTLKVLDTSIVVASDGASYGMRHLVSHMTDGVESAGEWTPWAMFSNQQLEDFVAWVQKYMKTRGHLVERDSAVH